MKSVAIVIVNWNGITDTRTCLDSVKKMNKQGANVMTIVVDNGSTDDSVSILKKQYPWVVTLVTGKNLGFTGGNNVGMRYAYAHGADLVWLLNNDTIVDADALNMVDAFDNDSVGIAGSKIYFAAGHEYHKDRYTKKEQGKVLWFAGGLVDWANMYASHRGVDEIDHGQYDKQQQTDFVTGCSMMIRREVIAKIGYLDDAYFLYLEDLDYCLRAKRAGFDLLYIPTSRIWHVNSGSTGTAGNLTHQYYQTRNRLRAGLLYAPLRTKIALCRESLRFLYRGPAIKRQAIIDVLLGRLGKQYEPKKTTP
jgi:GT2 family glycosyltransferase